MAVPGGQRTTPDSKGKKRGLARKKKNEMRAGGQTDVRYETATAQR
jgi:hypothetical protein